MTWQDAAPREPHHAGKTRNQRGAGRCKGGTHHGEQPIQGRLSSVADVAADLTAPDAACMANIRLDQVRRYQSGAITESLTDRPEDPRSPRSASLNASESGGGGTAAMLSFSSFSIRDILTGRVTRGGGVRAALDTCATGGGGGGSIKGAGLGHQGGEAHSAGHSVSEGSSPLSPDPCSDETASEGRAEREGELKGTWPEYK